MRRLEVAKYQGAGNDFLLIDARGEELPYEPLTGEEVRALCDRWAGIGADGVIEVGLALARDAEADGAQDLTMRLVNADGTGAELSGNGLRCVGAFAGELWDRSRDRFVVRTQAGPREVVLERDPDGTVRAATTQMGHPAFEKAAIPMRGPAWETFLRQPVEVGPGLTVLGSALSMGNPHLVLFVEQDPGAFHLEHMGPALEHHESFPERVNVEFARVGADGIDVRVWERGVGETLACGTGACAVLVAANEAGLVGPSATVRFRGGDLEVERDGSGEVFLGGPVGRVFEATTDLTRLGGAA